MDGWRRRETPPSLTHCNPGPPSLTFPMLVSSPDVDRPNHRESRLPWLPSRAQSSTLRCADSSTVNPDLRLDFLSWLDVNLFSEL